VATGTAFVRVLEEDPELAAALDPTSVQLATRHAIAAVEHVAPGAWEPAPPSDGGSGHLGLLVLDGLLMCDVTYAQATCTELLGHGDLLRPWDWEREMPTIRPEVSWTALQPVRLAVLDRRITAIIGRWPELVSAVVARSVRRSFELAVNQATSHLTRVDARLQLLFWGLADRWGRVGPDGIVLELPLTHQVLGRLVGAQRPSVTTALSDLARRGVIERRDDGAWILHGDPPGEAATVPVPASAARS
jgi:CRP/FNR family transcriptional regulator, cyclic AMP receptor protein